MTVSSQWWIYPVGPSYAYEKAPAKGALASIAERGSCGSFQTGKLCGPTSLPQHLPTTAVGNRHGAALSVVSGRAGGNGAR